jgi:hypothetical protein
MVPVTSKLSEVSVFYPTMLFHKQAEETGKGLRYR